MRRPYPRRHSRLAAADLTRDLVEALSLPKPRGPSDPAAARLDARPPLAQVLDVA